MGSSSAVYWAYGAFGKCLYDYAYMFSGEQSVVAFAEFGEDEMPNSSLAEELSEAFEKALCKACNEYKHAREAGRLNKAKVMISEPETHLLFRDVERYSRQTAPDQIKPVRSINSPKKEKFFIRLQNR